MCCGDGSASCGDADQGCMVTVYRITDEGRGVVPITSCLDPLILRLLLLWSISGVGGVGDDGDEAVAVALHA